MKADWYNADYNVLNIVIEKCEGVAPNGEQCVDGEDLKR